MGWPGPLKAGGEGGGWFPAVSSRGCSVVERTRKSMTQRERERGKAVGQGLRSAHGDRSDVLVGHGVD